MVEEKTIKEIYKEENYKIENLEEKNEENFFSFKGRITRLTYFIRSLVLWIPMVIIYLLIKDVDFIFSVSSSLIGFLSMCMLFLYILLMMQTIKRLHDTNNSGSYWLISFIPIACHVLGIYLLVKDGTIGGNKYGPDPKNRKEGEIYNKDDNSEINKTEPQEDIIKGIKNRYIISIIFILVFLFFFIIFLIKTINDFTWGLLIIDLLMFGFVIFLLERFVSIKEELNNCKKVDKSNKTKYCSKCGKKISITDKFCIKCGNKIK
ncbi:MAG: DUF805 domain-containing protein [Patescibacteria group bacterium]|nr:DUF805 domain-containing protein [Patescibacteria group bacterium]MDD4304222.1 DUF805 domain-containing protein [Patescibacteria group bacterium]MDD4695255.1 DUF805 domain-containing protein [Patescibacteria group bacterium]